MRLTSLCFEVVDDHFGNLMYNISACSYYAFLEIFLPVTVSDWPMTLKKVLAFLPKVTDTFIFSILSHSLFTAAIIDFMVTLALINSTL